MRMNRETKKELYVSPVLGVKEVKLREVICQSGSGTTQQYGNGDTSGWY